MTYTDRSLSPHSLSLAQEDALANAGGRPVTPRVELEDFKPRTAAADCLLTFFMRVTDGDVRVTTISDHRNMVNDLKRLQAHVALACPSSLLMQSICNTAMALAEIEADVAARIARENGIDEDGR